MHSQAMDQVIKELNQVIKFCNDKYNIQDSVHLFDIICDQLDDDGNIEIEPYMERIRESDYIDEYVLHYDDDWFGRCECHYMGVSMIEYLNSDV